MDVESVKRAIVDEVLRRLEERSQRDRRRALVIVTGVPADPEEVLSRIKAVERAGFQVTVLLSRAAVGALPPEELSRNVNGLSVLVGEGESAPALANDADLVVVPWLSLNTASKVVNIICDTPVTSVLVLALLLGKHVIACADEFDPQDSVLTRDLVKRSPALYQAIAGLCERLRAFGVRTVSGRELPTALTSWSLREESSFHSRANLHGGQTMRAQTDQAKRRVVTREDVMQAIGRGEPIVAGPGTIFTPLANEVVQSRGWPVIEEGLPCGRGS